MADDGPSHGVGLGGHSEDTDSFVNHSSNLEFSSEPEISQNLISRCRWFGKIYFSSILAEPIFNDANGAMRGDNLEENLDAAKREFPYQKCIEKLPSLLSKPVQDLANLGSSPSSQSFVLTGMILQDANPDTRRQLYSLIRSRGTTATAFEIQEPGFMLSPPTTPRAKIPLLSISSQGKSPVMCESTVETAKYSVALNEYCMKKSVTSSWDEPKQVVYHPLPVFRATLRCSGLTFNGEAQSKRLSKHICAQQACEMLGIVA